MKTRHFVTLLILLIILPSFSLLAQKGDFSGEWTLNKEKSTISESELFLAKITMQIKSDTLFTTRVYENGMGESYPFDEKISLDGKECKIVIYDMPRTSTASLSSEDNTLTIASTTSFNGGMDDMVAKEIWKVDGESKMLTLEFTNKMSGNETTATYYYEKEK